LATLVTGGTGFVGANIVRALAQAGHQVVSLDVVPADDLVRRFVEPWSPAVTWLEGDILDSEALNRAGDAASVDLTVHNTAYTPCGEIERDEARRVVEINLQGTLNVLEVGRRVGVRRFIYVSSAGVYGELPPPSRPIGEDQPLRPQGVYGITKYASESLTQRYGELYGFEAASLRLAQNWGPMERVTPYRSRMSLPYQWVGSALRGEPIDTSPVGSGITEGRRFGVEHPYVADSAACVLARWRPHALLTPSTTCPRGSRYTSWT